MGGEELENVRASATVICLRHGDNWVFVIMPRRSALDRSIFAGDLACCPNRARLAAGLRHSNLRTSCGPPVAHEPINVMARYSDVSQHAILALRRTDSISKAVAPLTFGRASHRFVWSVRSEERRVGKEAREQR